MSKRTKTRRPNRFIYYFFGFIVSILSFSKRKVRYTFTCPNGKEVYGNQVKNELLKIKPPYIIVGNHHSLYDFVFMIRAFYPRRINFVVARKLYLASPYHFLIKLARSVPKNLFQPDIQTIRQSFDILGNEGILALYPEGQIVINGISKDMPESSGKLIKKMKLPVFAVTTQGGYLCDSTWRKKLKHGIIDVGIKITLMPEQIKEMTAEQIDEHIANAIYVDNFAYQEKTGNLYTGRNRSAGLENILYFCPNCKSEFSLKTSKNSIFCTHCGCSAEYTETAHLSWAGETQHFPHIGEWYNGQRAEEKQNIQKDSDFDLFIPVELRQLSENDTVIPNGNVEMKVRKTKKIEKCGVGILHISRNSYVYSGEYFGEQKEIEFDPNKLRYIPYTPGNNFQIYVQDVMFAFHTIDPRHCAKAALVMENIYEINNETKKQEPINA